MLIATSCLAGVASGVRDWDASAVVSISTNRSWIAPLSCRPHLVLEFSDIHAPRDGRRIGPRPQDVDTLLAFLRLKPARLLIHCTAGLGRSPAAAIIALIASGRTPKDACAAVYRLVPEASPNRRILRIGSQMLGLDFQADEEAYDKFEQQRDIQGAMGEATGLRAQWA